MQRSALLSLQTCCHWIKCWRDGWTLSLLHMHCLLLKSVITHILVAEILVSLKSLSLQNVHEFFMSPKSWCLWNLCYMNSSCHWILVSSKSLSLHEFFMPPKSWCDWNLCRYMNSLCHWNLGGCEIFVVKWILHVIGTLVCLKSVITWILCVTEVLVSLKSLYTNDCY